MSFFMYGCVIATWGSRLPLIKHELRLSSAELSVALLALPAGVMTATLFVPAVTRRLSSAGVMRVGTIGASCALALLAVASDLAALAGFLVFFGIWMGAWEIAMNTQGVAIERAYGRPIMSGLHGMYSVGILSGALAGALAARAGIDPLIHFSLAGCVFACAAAVGTRHLTGLEADAVLTHASDAPTLRMPPPALLVIGLIAFCAYFAEGAVDNWSGVFLHEIRNASYAVAPLGTTLCGAGMAVARFRGDAAITRFGRYLTLAGASVVACAGLALAVTAGSIALSILGFGIFGVGTATIVPIAFTLAGNVAGTRPSWAISRVAGFGYAGLLSSPAIIGFVAGAAGLSAALLIPAVLLLAVLPASAAAKDS